jgi:hypothetical protein
LGNNRGGSLVYIGVNISLAVLTQAQWQRVECAIPYRHRPTFSRRRKRRGGRPSVPDKTVFEALVWTIGGGTLDRLPRRFGSRSTTLRRLKAWYSKGLVEPMWRAYIATLAPAVISGWEARLRARRVLPFWQDMLKMEFLLRTSGRPS